MPERVRIGTRVTPHNRDALVAFATANGISLNGLIDAIFGTVAFELDGRPSYDVNAWSDDPMADAWRKVVADARMIDARNRSRSGNGDELEPPG